MPVQVLRAENVDYAIVGAMAASVHGAIRASRDADALLSISSMENVLDELHRGLDSGLELD